MTSKSRLIITNITIAAFLAAPLASAQTTVSQPMSLRAAVEMARTRNPSYMVTREIINQNEAQIPLTRAAILPNANLYGYSTYEKNAVTSPTSRFNGDPYNVYETDLNVKQPLFQVGSISAIQSVQKSRDMSQLDAEAARRDLTNSVIGAYYLITLNARNVDTLLRQQSIVRESLATAEHREHTGRGQLLDVLQVKTQIALLDAQISSAKNQLAVAAATLANLLGDNEAKEFRVRGGLEVPQLHEIDSHVDLTKFRLPELEKNRVGLLQIEDQRQVIIGQHLPNLAFTGDLFYTATDKSDVFDDSSKSWQMMVTLTIPIFSGLSNIYQRRTLASQQTQLEYSRVNLQNSFTLQQVSSRKNLETAEQSIISGIEALKLAIASSNEALRNYRLATIDFLQFLTVQQAYVQAEQSLNASKYSYITALGSYYVASGQDLDSLIDILEGVNR